jgi:hypothetical protein
MMIPVSYLLKLPLSRKPRLLFFLLLLPEWRGVMLHWSVKSVSLMAVSGMIAL